jgi:hypothetical protein
MSHILKCISSNVVVHGHVPADLLCDLSFQTHAKWDKCINLFRDCAEEYLYISGINELHLTVIISHLLFIS